MTLTRRERLRENTREEIKSIARKHMQEQGTAAISLRAIARDMGLTVTALYRYYPSHDDLVTALIVDAFNALADTMEQADSSQPRERYAERLMAVMLAYREWAMQNSGDFQLIYGNPIPGYHAPSEVTVPAVVRGFRVVVGILAEAMANGELQPSDEYQQLPPHVSAYMTELIERDGYNIPLQPMYLGVSGWVKMHGMIMLELFHHTPSVVGDPEEFYRFEINNILKSAGLSLK